MKRFAIMLFLVLAAMVNAATYYVDGTLITTGTAQGANGAGGTNDIQLAADAPATDLTGYGIRIIAGTGMTTLNDREITSYNTDTKVAVVNSNWSTDVDETSVYQVTVGSNVNNGAESTPWQTLNGAVAGASGTHTIYVVPATYNEKQSTNNYWYISSAGNSDYLTFLKKPGTTGDIIVATTATDYCVRISATTAAMTFVGFTFAPVSHATNAAVYLTSVSCTLNLIDCTIVNKKSDANAFGVVSALTSEGSGSVLLKNCYIETSSTAVAFGAYLAQTAGTIIVDGCYVAVDRAASAGIGIAVGSDADTNANPIAPALVRNNRVTYLGADNSHGILVGAGANGTVVEGNYVSGGDIQFVVKSEYCTVKNNVFINPVTNANYGAIIKGGCYNRFVGNTIYSGDTVALYINDGAGGGSVPSARNIVTDNVFFCVADPAVILQDGANNNILDYNCYYSTGTNVMTIGASTVAQADGVSAIQAAWQAIGDMAVYYNDQNSIIVNPGLDANYRATSPALQSAGSPILLKSDGTVLLRNPIGATAGGGSEKSVFGVKRSVFGN